MKVVVVFALLLVVVAGVAASGSRARALAATSVAFEQCSDAANTDRCRPLIGGHLVQAEFEGERQHFVGGQVVGAGAGPGDDVGDSRVGFMVVFSGMWDVARYYLGLGDYWSGGRARLRAPIVPETSFDPISAK